MAPSVVDGVGFDGTAWRCSPHSSDSIWLGGVGVRPCEGSRLGAGGMAAWHRGSVLADRTRSEYCGTCVRPSAELSAHPAGRTRLKRELGRCPRPSIVDGDTWIEGARPDPFV